MKKFREVTTTKLVLDELQRAEDFLTVANLAARTGRTVNQVWAAVSHLFHVGAIEVERDGKGTSWWYWLDVRKDVRQFTRSEYLPHVKPRRKPRVVVLPKRVLQ